MQALTLYHNDMSVCAQKVRMALEFKQLEWQSEHLNLREGDQFKPKFKAINPQMMVPVLVDGQNIITDSNVILEYLDDSYADVPLYPLEPVSKAKVRGLLIKLDAGLHEQIAVISFCLAFREQLLDKYPNQESLNKFLAQIPSPHRAAVMKDTIANGVDSTRFSLALYAYNDLLRGISERLETSSWLAGDSVTAADIAYIPYFDRLEQLGLKAWWDQMPSISDWLNRVRGLDSYNTGISSWLNQNYINLMEKNSAKSWMAVNKILTEDAYINRIRGES
jgi:glutathione S-transferase